MDAAEHLPHTFPWRTATLVAAAIAAVELVALIAAGSALLVHPAKKTAAAVTTAPAVTVAAKAPVVHRAVVPVHTVKVTVRPLRARSAVEVLVLNGNGISGVAHTEAAHLQSLGYRIGGAANAPPHHYGQSMVMFVPGYAKEARRLAHDTGIRLVAPIDGLTSAMLKSSRLVVLLGS
ncbi:MAG: LytR C-terminal domain-containing protein [Actinobacteria bacterium]|nr:LytR C-terminal domain-containing protein [Actinomycetota bacterium]MBV8480594.1 LytR C-terminal domain-containing protein [Actinomycetota bacterium]